MAIPTFNGETIPVLSIQPDWTQPVVLRPRYKTTIAEAIDLTEERQNLAPRALYGLDYQSFTLSTQESGYLKRVLDLADDLPVAVPLWPMATKLSVAASSSATTLTVDDTTGCLFDIFHQHAILWEDFKTWEIVELNVVGTTSVTLLVGLSRAYTTKAKLIPIAYGALARESITGLTDASGEWKCSFEEVFHSLNDQEIPEDNPDDVNPTPPLTDLCGGWWKADSFSLADGTAIGGTGKEWIEQTGNGRNLVQATVGSRPLFKTNVFGTRPAIRFDGIDDFLTFTSDLEFRSIGGTLSLSCTIIIVYKQTAADNNGMLLGGTSVPATKLQSKGLSNEFYCYDGIGTIATSAVLSTSPTAVRVMIFRNQCFVAHQFFRENKTNQGPISQSNLGFGFGLMGKSDVGILAGDIAEMLAYCVILSDGQLDAIYDNYLKIKYPALP